VPLESLLDSHFIKHSTLIIIGSNAPVKAFIKSLIAIPSLISGESTIDPQFKHIVLSLNAPSLTESHFKHLNCHTLLVLIIQNNVIIN